MILDKKASVQRLTPDQSDNDKEQYASVTGLGNIDINIQPASPELVAVTEGALGRTYDAYTTISGIKIGDRITVSGTNDHFIVKGVRDWFFPPIPHLELTLFLGDE
jgi:hypothetical protein